MERSPTRDLIVGIFVLMGIAAIAYLSISVGGFSWHGRSGLKLSAAFDETGALTERAPVVMAGVRVERVSHISLGKNFHAKVDMDLDPDLGIPTDTYANIVTSGVLGDRYIELQPGTSHQMLKSGDTIANTADAVIIEKVINQFFHGSSGGGKPSQNGLTLSASFDETGTLPVHAPVVVAGVRVGEVTNIGLDKNLRAKVEMNLDSDIKLSTDTTASIVTSGVLGDRYIELQSGAEDQMLKSGDQITFTESAVILERVIGQLIYGMTKGTKPGATTQPAKTQ